MAHTLRLLPVALTDTDGRQSIITRAASSLWAMALGFLLPALTDASASFSLLPIS